MPTPRECPRCGKVFPVKPTDIDRRVTCSRACATRTPAERFWPKVKKGDVCWEWTGSIDKLGYGQFGGDRCVVIGAHRFSYQLHHGSIPEGAHILHSCDNRRCVRPDHLRAGTHRENMADCIAKGRQSKGDRHFSAKLTAQRVVAARQRYAEGGISRRTLAAIYGVGSTTMQSVLERKTWREAA